VRSNSGYFTALSPSCRDGLQKPSKTATLQPFLPRSLTTARKLSPAAGKPAHGESSSVCNAEEEQPIVSKSSKPGHSVSRPLQSCGNSLGSDSDILDDSWLFKGKHKRTTCEGLGENVSEPPAKRHQPIVNVPKPVHLLPEKTSDYLKGSPFTSPSTLGAGTLGSIREGNSVKATLSTTMSFQESDMADLVVPDSTSTGSDAFEEQLDDFATWLCNGAM
jgi:hypothetical protein